MIEFLVNGTEKITFSPRWIYCLGNSGRTGEDRAAHMKELCCNGIPYDNEMRLGFNIVSPILLTQERNIDVLGENTTGEVEIVIFMTGGKWYVTVGSDHGDRVLERFCSDLTKQICAKPIAREAWPLDDVLPHWDNLKMSTNVVRKGIRIPYQQGTVETLMTPQKVLEEIQSHNLPSKDGCVYFCGTLLMEEGKFLPGEAYDMSLEDPVLNRKIDYSYTVTVLKDHITYFKL